MKLQDYFHHQKHTFLTDNEKFSLYQEIVAKRDIKKSILQRYAFAKRMAYASFVVLFVMAVYGVHFFRDDLRYMTNSLIVQNAWDTVQAWYIAQIVHFDGSFIIEHDGKKLQTSVIRNWDIVTLKDNTEMVFHIDDQTQAQLIGPAQFVLNSKGEENEQSYTLQLIQGNFVEIQSLTEMTTQDVSLIADDVIVKQEKWDTASHFKLSKEGDNKRIENKWAEIKVTRNQEDNAIETKVAAKQTLALAVNDITLIDDETQIARVLVQKDITQTVALAQVKENVVADEEINITALSSVFKKQEDIKVSETVVSAVDTMIAASTQGKNVVTPEQNDKLRGSLYAEFLLKDMESLLIAHIEDNDQVISRNINSLQEKIISLYKAFWLVVPQVDGYSFAATISLAKELQSNLDEKYYMPPRYMQNINAIIHWLEYIKSQPTGSQEDGKAYREKASTSLPSNLRFQ
jgi:hypothetical protein